MMVDPVSRKKTILVSDAAQPQSPTSWHKSRVGCRSDLHCDLEAVDAMQSASHCQRRVPCPRLVTALVVG